MSVVTIITNGLAFIAVLFIIFFLINILWNKLSAINNKIKMSKVNPPLAYMQSVGARCPDYFVFNGTDSKGNYICVNKYNIKVNANNPVCTTDQVTFSPIPNGYTWDSRSDTGLIPMTDKDKQNFVNSKGNALMSRNDWIKN